MIDMPEFTIHENDDAECWCDSGLLYKSCHKNRHHQKAPNRNEIIKAFKKADKSIGCLYQGEKKCKNKAISSHTLQRKNVLDKISVDSHVYSFELDYFGKERIVPKYNGINNASVFPGFCNKHDSILFKKIEDDNFILNNESAFLLAYRSLCREYFHKVRGIEILSFAKNLDKGKNLEEQIAFQFSLQKHREMSLSGLRDFEYYKKKYDLMLLEKKYISVKYLAIEIEELPILLLAGTASVELDFQANHIQKWYESEKPLENYNLTIIPYKKGGLVIFTWLDQDKSCEKLISSLLKINKLEIGNAIIRLAFEYFDNVHLSPLWWEPLDKKIKLAIKQRVNSGIEIGTRGPYCLTNDNINYANWTIADISTNFGNITMASC